MTSHTGRSTSVQARARAWLPWLLAVLAMLAASAPASPQPTTRPITRAPLPLIPMPARIEVASGHHRLAADTALRYRDPAAAKVARQFADLLARTTGLELVPSPTADTSTSAAFRRITGW